MFKFLANTILKKLRIDLNLNNSNKTILNRLNKEAKVTNFFQVEEVLRHIGVKFDAKLIHMIMNEERGASIRLLYQIKLALDKLFSQSDMTVTNLK